MAQPTDLPSRDAAIDELVTQLLECGAVLSQIIGHMARWQATGHSAPDAAPIPVVAHQLIGGVLTDVRRRYSRRDLMIAGSIVREVTDAISNDLFLVPDEP
jgi:hypothetical protein